MHPKWNADSLLITLNYKCMIRIFFILFMCLIAFVSSAGKDINIKVDGLVFLITDETRCTVQLSKIKDKYCSVISIPSSVQRKGKDYSVTAIGDGAFKDCSSLTSVDIPNSIVSIGEKAFYGCKSVTIIKSHNPLPPEVKGNGFEQNVYVATLYVPNGCKSVYYNTYPWNNFCEIIEETSIDKEDIAQHNSQDTHDISGETDYKSAAEVRDKMGEFNLFVENEDPNSVIADVKQSGSVDSERDNKNEAHASMNVSQMPVFPGGEAALQRFIYDHLKYPRISLEEGVQGTVMLRFVVNENGSVGDVQILQSLDTYCDLEAKRVVQSLPRFAPGRMQGKPVKVSFQFPIRFEIDNTEENLIEYYTQPEQSVVENSIVHTDLTNTNISKPSKKAVPSKKTVPSKRRTSARRGRTHK